MCLLITKAVVVTWECQTYDMHHYAFYTAVDRFLSSLAKVFKIEHSRGCSAKRAWQTRRARLETKRQNVVESSSIANWKKSMNWSVVTVSFHLSSLLRSRGTLEQIWRPAEVIGAASVGGLLAWTIWNKNRPVLKHRCSQYGRKHHRKGKCYHLKKACPYITDT